MYACSGMHVTHTCALGLFPHWARSVLRSECKSLPVCIRRGGVYVLLWASVLWVMLLCFRAMCYIGLERCVFSMGDPYNCTWLIGAGA